MNPYQRRAVAFTNEMRRSCGALLGIVQGLLSDNILSDQEIRFLRDWLQQNDAVAHVWPGDVILGKIQEILADGSVEETERQHLAQVLQQLIGGTLDQLAESTHVTELALDQVQLIDFPDKSFCLTGEFVFGPRKSCEDAIARRGGNVLAGITKKLHYVVVGGLGSPEWKHGSFGNKIEKAIQYRRSGQPLLIVHEDVWAASMSRAN